MTKSEQIIEKALNNYIGCANLNFDQVFPENPNHPLTKGDIEYIKSKVHKIDH